ncbi:DJ-1/PfpI family protein [Xylophilus sp.]|uniref:DJ-1/PfpI family protein n=1 Tax=Xylophilus sp. TaxID=2653893 RepID=UPI0013BD0AE6|nr:DJ-1/PfpI family protein [Xylophilus sp.]KAF1042154.1 MAG: Isonitrile hydratase [Xylophilus sp.]
MTSAHPPAIDIVFALYPGVTQLDFTGPWQVLSRVPGARLVAASPGGVPLPSEGLVFSGLARLEDVRRCDIVLVPGGPGALPAAEDPVFVGAVRRLAAQARYVTSVCTGSLVLGAAGLLQGRRATSHWTVRDLLPAFGAVPDAGRVVRDGRVITGGGVTAGIDFALVLAAELAGDEVAQAIQLGLEYAPAPPFDAGRPETAPPRVLERVRLATAQLQAQRRAAVARIAGTFPIQGMGQA